MQGPSETRKRDDITNIYEDNCGCDVKLRLIQLKTERLLLVVMLVERKKPQIPTRNEHRMLP